MQFDADISVILEHKFNPAIGGGEVSVGFLGREVYHNYEAFKSHEVPGDAKFVMFVGTITHIQICDEIILNRFILVYAVTLCISWFQLV